MDHWQIPLPETLSEPGFPGAEVERRESWGTVGKLPGDGSGPSLMLNAHVDVVPPGDLAAWGDAAAFAGHAGATAVHGNGKVVAKRRAPLTAGRGSSS